MKISPKKPSPPPPPPPKIESKPKPKPRPPGVEASGGASAAAAAKPQGPGVADIRAERAARQELPQPRTMDSSLLSSRLNHQVDEGDTGLSDEVLRRLPPEDVAALEAAGAGEGVGPAPATNPAGQVPQQWQNTCGPNALMTLEAAVDPARASEFQGTTAPQERSELEASIYGSSPNFNPNPNPREPGSSNVGWGSWEMSQQISDRFVGDAVTVNPANRDEAVDGLTTALENGQPVAIGLSEHWVSATDIRSTPDGNEILVHDSWSGESAWVSEETMRDTSGDWMEDAFPGSPFQPAIAVLVYPETPQLDPNSTFRGNE